MKRVLFYLLTLTALCAVLVGCVYEGVDVTINDDGSGSVALKAGYSKEYLLESLSDVDPDEAQARIDALTPFEADGKTYFGVTGENSFDSPESFSAALAELSAEAEELMENPAGVTEGIRLVRDGDGLMLVVDNRAIGESVYKADDAETERRAEALYHAWTSHVSGLEGDGLRRLAAVRAENLRGYTTEEFEDYLLAINDEPVQEFGDYLSREVEYLEWTGLDDDMRAAREAEVADTLRGKGLSTEDASRCAAYFVDFYDFPPMSFSENLAELKSFDKDTLRGELEFLSEVYENAEPEALHAEQAELDAEPTKTAAEPAEGDDEAVLRVTARFGTPVTQIAGGMNGVSIEKGVVTLELTEMSAEVYRFTTRDDVPLAYERPSAVELDGEAAKLDCYVLRDASGKETLYARVRDVAALLKDTRAHFAVKWEDAAVKLTTGGTYEEGAVSRPFSGPRTYERPVVRTLVNGVETALDSLALHDENGGGYTYYELRELGDALGFDVRWDSERGVVCIESVQSRVA